MRNAPMPAFAGALASLALAAAPVDGGARAPRWFPLLSVAQIGSIGWRCDASGAVEALRLRAGPETATEVVTVPGRVARRAVLQPGEALVMPTRGERRLRIDVVQATEARSLRATVTVEAHGRRAACRPYFPPAVTLSLND